MAPIHYVCKFEAAEALKYMIVINKSCHRNIFDLNLPGELPYTYI